MKLVILASIDFEEKVNLEEVYNEWDAQIISFMKVADALIILILIIMFTEK